MSPCVRLLPSTTRATQEIHELKKQPGAFGGVRLGEGAGCRGEPRQCARCGAVRWLVGAGGDEDLSVILINPSRKGRNEPRVKKRRPKPYPLMTKPRAVLRKQWADNKVAA